MNNHSAVAGASLFEGVRSRAAAKVSKRLTTLLLMFCIVCMLHSKEVRAALYVFHGLHVSSPRDHLPSLHRKENYPHSTT